jgi:hypothetical protein
LNCALVRIVGEVVRHSLHVLVLRCNSASKRSQEGLLRSLRPASTAASWTAGLLYFVSQRTRPEFRRKKRDGKSCTLHLSHASREHGKRGQVVAFLQRQVKTLLLQRLPLALPSCHPSSVMASRASRPSTARARQQNDRRRRVALRRRTFASVKREAQPAVGGVEI